MRNDTRPDIRRSERVGDFCAELAKNVGDDGQRRDSAFFKLNRIMETP